MPDRRVTWTVTTTETYTAVIPFDDSDDADHVDDLLSRHEHDGH